MHDNISEISVLLYHCLHLTSQQGTNCQTLARDRAILILRVLVSPWVFCWLHLTATFLQPQNSTAHICASFCLRRSRQLRLAQRRTVYASAFGLNSHTGSAYPAIIQNKNLWITPNHIANIAKQTKTNTLTIKSEQINTTGQAKCASATTNTAVLNMQTVYTCVIVDLVVLICNETC